MTSLLLLVRWLVVCSAVLRVIPFNYYVRIAYNEIDRGLISLRLGSQSNNRGRGISRLPFIRFGIMNMVLSSDDMNPLHALLLYSPHG